MGKEHRTPYQPDQAKEQSHTPEVVLVGEYFPLFPIHRTDIRQRQPGWGFDDIPTFWSEVRLHTNGALPILPAQFWVVAEGPAPAQAFTPFTPDVGYHVTAEDFDPAAREEKVSSSPWLERAFTPMPEAVSALSAFIPADHRDVASLVVQPARGNRPRFRPDIAEQLSRLAFQVSVPNGLRFMSGPETGPDGAVYHRGFYPFDFGPLAVPEIGIPGVWSPGLCIAVPPNLDLLAQIEGRFVLR